MIDKKVIELVRSQHEKARQILIDNKRIMDALAEYLYKKETITGEEFMLIIREQTRQKQIGMDYTSAMEMDMSAARPSDAPDADHDAAET